MRSSPPFTPKSMGTVPSTAVAALKVSIALKSAALGADDGAERALALATRLATSAAVCGMVVLWCAVVHYVEMLFVVAAAVR